MGNNAFCIVNSQAVRALQKQLIPESRRRKYISWAICCSISEGGEGMGYKYVIGQPMDLTSVRRGVIVRVQEGSTWAGIGEPSSADCVCRLWRNWLEKIAVETWVWKGVVVNQCALQRQMTFQFSADVGSANWEMIAFSFKNGYYRRAKGSSYLQPVLIAITSASW